MKKIKIGYQFLLFLLIGLILVLAGWLLFNAYAKYNETGFLSEKIHGLLEYVSLKQVDKNNAAELTSFLAGEQTPTTTSPITTNPFKIFEAEDEIIIVPTTTTEN